MLLPAEIHHLLRTDAKLKPGSSWPSHLTRTRAAINSNSRTDSMQCRYQASTNNAIRLAVIIDNALCVPGETFHKDTDAALT